MRYLQLLAILILLSSCSSNKSLPAWIDGFEHDPQYFSALSVVNAKQPDYKELARDYAAREIAMQISTSIESDVNILESERYGISQTEYLSSVRSSTSARLTNLSPVHSYEDGQKYYVLYRLSKAEYYAQRALLRDRALVKAADLMQKYDLNQGNSSSGILLLISALDIVAEFLDMPLIYGGQDLGTQIFARLYDLPQRLIYEWDFSEVEVTAKGSKPIHISGKTFLDDLQTPVSGVPLSFSSETIKVPEAAFSDQQGRFAIAIKRIDSFAATQYIDLHFDRHHYDAHIQNPTASGIWHSLPFVARRLRLKVSRPKLYLDYAYVSGYQSGFSESITGYLANLNLEQSPKVENAQYILQVRIFSKEGDYLPRLNYYTTFADIHLTLLDPKTGATVNYLELMNLKSGGNSPENAQRNTERDAVKEICDTLLYRLVYPYLIK
ncbi:MAG: hypothetical protein RBR69_09945 [Candidatus Cloacimonadaceae bacterium]|jgi:hypothetical protein|nr:LPP20 family lipoprotein [Candidatus Cloacimonadota bacterium]MDY0128440.1 hypothetical protein [Candidatus Cloacimonadaceae bacterium]MCB5254458.1 LPP20 family lipoprotein [Candidatus Cloacimonadota bacterium]MCK9179077.1 LPP20 family lipoprotein [Candidatus Cloacimonadota bacterium]MCK9243079.1 LPP20 family lipoprotein [Candidatus Cloacimonadota bacterium]